MDNSSGVGESEDELLRAIEQMKRRVLNLESERSQWDRLETALKRTHDLGERMKELFCIHSLWRLSTREENPFVLNLWKIMRMIRDGWQFPRFTCVRIKWDDRDFKSRNYGNTRARLVEKIVVNGKSRGEVEVGYLIDRPAAWEGPFLKEEINLLRAVALWVAFVIAKFDSAKVASQTHSHEIVF